jgi:aryl-alcohol dehydrogenase
MQIKAAIFRSTSQPFSVETVTLDEPREEEVLVKIVACGICHTDLSVKSQHLPPQPPAVLGHEGAGVVERVGRRVSGLSAGDHVVLSFLSCGRCEPCDGGQPYACDRMLELNFSGRAPDGRATISDSHGAIASSFFGQSSFATYAIGRERNCVKVPKDIALEKLGPLGCGVQTGAGAAINALGLRPGATVAIFGAGSVGLSAVMGAMVAGATRIISIDLNERRLELARELGATHTVRAAHSDPVEELTKLSPGGVPFILETSGNPQALTQGVKALRSGGMLGIVGAPPFGTEITLEVHHLLFNRTIRGIIEGLSNPPNFIPRLVELYRQGRFPFDKLVKFYGLDDINQAVHDSETGVTVKPVLRMA